MSVAQHSLACGRAGMLSWQINDGFVFIKCKTQHKCCATDLKYAILMSIAEKAKPDSCRMSFRH
jgi:hypothetical protein